MSPHLTASASLLALVAAAPALGAQAAAQPVQTDDIIIVTTLPIQVTTDEVVGSVSVIDEASLIRLVNGNLADTLESLPGVSSSYYGPASGRPVIRGLGEDRVQILVNGLTVMDASASSPDHAVAGEVLGARQIEILRGPAAIAYGGNAIGGVVNVLDGRIATEPVEGAFDGFLYLGATSVDGGTQAAGRIAFGAGPFVFQLEGLRREAENFDIPGFAESAAFRAMEEDDHHHDEDHHDDHDHEEHEEEEEEEDFETVSDSFYTFETFSGSASLVESWGFVGFGFKTTDAEYGLPGHSHAHGHEDEHDDDHDEDHHDDHDHDEHDHEEEEGALLVMEQTRIDVRGEVNRDGFFNRVRWSLAYGDYEHSEIEGSGEIGVTFTRDGVEGRVELAHTHEGVRSGAWGIQFLNQDFAALGEEAFVEPVNTQDWGLFAVERWDYESWGIEGGARIESRELSGQRADRSFDTFSASGSLFLRPVEQAFLAATISRTERAPTDTEVFSNGPHLATETFEIGDLNLDAETAWSFEGAARWRGEGWRAEAAVFHTAYDGFIGLFPTGEEEDELDVFEYRQADADFTGFEVSGSTDLGDAFGAAWSADGSVDYVQAELDGGGDLPRIPPLSSLIGVEADFGQINARAEARLVAEQDEIAEFELATDGYALLNAQVEWTPLTEHDVTLIAGVRNITDEEARSHTSFLKDLVPLPGRNFRIAVVAGF